MLRTERIAAETMQYPRKSKMKQSKTKTAIKKQKLVLFSYKKG
jgi:hypothetical protein